MQDSVRIRMAIHSAESPEEIGRILQEFFATLPVQQRSLLRPNLLDMETYSDSSVGQKALELARAELFAGPHDPARPLLAEVGAVLSAAALKLAVMELEARPAA